jgi:DNA-binding XRE family transcriptional regulator
MTAEEYRRVREKIGSQSYVAERLGLNKMTISNRERGRYDVSKEAELAISHLYNFNQNNSDKILRMMQEETGENLL